MGPPVVAGVSARRSWNRHGGSSCGAAQRAKEEVMAGGRAGSPWVLSPGEGRSVQMGGLGVRYMLEGAETGGGFALVEHPIAPRALAAPLHRHANEDEYTFVLEGEVGVQVGEEITV